MYKLNFIVEARSIYIKLMKVDRMCQEIYRVKSFWILVEIKSNEKHTFVLEFLASKVILLRHQQIMIETNEKQNCMMAEKKRTSNHDYAKCIDLTNVDETLYKMSASYSIQNNKQLMQ